MIERLLDFCLRERLVVLVGSIAIIAFGWYSTKKVPVDAIPNVGENQVIVLTEWPGRSPKDIEDQITYPLSIALQSVAGAESVRGKSMFGFSFVQVTFEDSTDFYWARSRVAEQLLSLPSGKIPKDYRSRIALTSFLVAWCSLDLVVPIGQFIISLISATDSSSSYRSMNTWRCSGLSRWSSLKRA